MTAAPRSPRAVLVGRLALLLLAIAASVAALALVHDRDRDRARSEADPTERWVCPMHPEVVAHAPGECPICRMALERAAGPAAMGEGPAAKSGIVGIVRRRVVTQLVRAPAWSNGTGTITALLHADDLAGLVADEPARFFGDRAPAAPVPVTRAPGPPTPWDDATLQVGFHGAAPPGGAADVGWLELAARPRDLLVVPSSAVLYSGTGAYVLAAPPDGHIFTRREVEIGRILDSGYVAGLVEERYGAIVVRAGLAEGERIVVEDAFFLDAERRLQAARGNPAEVTL